MAFSLRWSQWFVVWERWQAQEKALVGLSCPIVSLPLNFSSLRHKLGIMTFGLRQKLSIVRFCLRLELSVEDFGLSFELGVVVGGHPKGQDGL